MAFKGKIAFVNTNLITSGGILTNFEYVQELKKRGYSAAMLAKEGNEELERLYGIDHLPIELLEEFTDDDVIIANRWEQCDDLEKYKGRKIQFIQGNDLLYWKDDEKALENLKRVRNNPKWELIGVSEYVLKDWGRGIVIPNGINARFFVNHNLKRDIDIIIEGNNEHNKNIQEAIILAKNSCPSGKIVWLGRETVETEGVETISNPPQQEIPKIYQRSKVMIKLSKSEGFCLPILEAMASGCLVVTKDMGGNDFCKSGNNCWFLEDLGKPGNPTIQDLLETSDNWVHGCIAGGFKTARENTWKNSTDKLLNYLNASSRDRSKQNY